MCKEHEIKQYKTFDELPQELKDKFKNKTTKKNLEKAKDGYVSFINELNRRGDTLVGNYINAQTKLQIKYFKCQHLIEIKPDAYKHSCKCPICDGKQVVQGINDIATTHPHILQHLVNKEDAYKYTCGSNKKIEVYCETCGEKRMMIVQNVVRYGTNCKSCAFKGERNPFYGQKHDEETCKKISDGLYTLYENGYVSPQKGVTRTEEQKAKISEALTGKCVGELSSNWKGGITPIKHHLRYISTVEDWFTNSKKRTKYTCQLTGKPSSKLHSHHLYSFSNIVRDAHVVNNIDIKPQVKDYTQEELKLLEDYVNEWHKDNSNAVVLCDEVHKLFHQEYGYGDNTPEQFEEFKQRYFNGEFNKDNTEVTQEIKAS